MSKQEKLIKLIEEGKEILKTAFDEDVSIAIKNDSWIGQRNERHCPIIKTFVNNDLFTKWHEKVRIFLAKNDFQDSFINLTGFGTNFDITKEQVLLLEAIYESIDESNCFQSNESWEYLPDCIKHLFNDGHYKQAVLDAFIFIEDQVRKKSRLEGYGTDLMRRAFNKDTGPLSNMNLPDAERESQSHLFTGAIGFIKNPKSHNIIVVKKQKAIELLHMANYLLRILDGDYSERT